MEDNYDIFRSGREGFGIYRIPAILCTMQGSLLAFCEARRILSDHAENKIVLKRSTDDGKTWGDLIKIADAGKDSLNNPLVIQEESSENIILMYQKYPLTKPQDVEDPEEWISHSTQSFPANIHEGAVGPGFHGRVCRTYVQTSDDDGKSWSDPEEITRQVKYSTKVTNYACGPGVGIQLKSGIYKGRLVMPFSQGPWGTMKIYAVFSDDLGKSWTFGYSAGSKSGEQANEVQIVELLDGSLMMNARSFKGNRLRKVTHSHDGGTSWTDLKDDSNLLEPECQGSIIRYSGFGDNEISRILFLNPAHYTERKKGILRISYDEGNSWPVMWTIHEGGFGYSGMAKLFNGDIGILFERDNYEAIRFVRISVQELASRESLQKRLQEV